MSNELNIQAVISAAELVKKARRGIVLTGAGISTPSGIPDFRSEDSGLWQRFNPHEVATLSSFRYRPENFFTWMRDLARDIFAAAPNPAHTALTQLETAGYITTIVTQNIDGLHQRAGSGRVLEVHGSLSTLTCIRCYLKFDSQGFIEPYLINGTIPACPKCHGILKPDVILFEEQLPIRTWMQAQDSFRKSDLVIVAGSSLEVMPVAGLPMMAIENGAPLILINETPTYLDVRAQIVLRGDVAEILPAIAAEVLCDG